MNVTIISGAARISGGAEKIAVTSALELAARGHKVRLLAVHGPAADLLSDVHDLQVEILDPDPMAEGRNLVERAKLTWPSQVVPPLEQVFSSLKGEADSVIHFHCGYLELGIPGFRALARSEIPVVYTHHDYSWGCPLSGFYNYSTEKNCPLVGGSLGCLATDCTNRYLEKLVRYGRHMGTHQTSGIGRAVKHHIFVSETSRTKLAPYLPKDAETSVVYNGIECDKTARVAATGDSSLIFVGRLTSEKDPLAFADSARNARMPARIVGDGPLRPKLKRAGYNSMVTGWKEPEEVSNLISGSRALVLTSRWMETAGLVIQEAAALGVPSVVPMGTAAAEFVEHGKTGLHYDRSNSASLTETLSRLKDTPFANTLGEAAYLKFWDNPPTWANHVDRLEEVYERVIAR